MDDLERKHILQALDEKIDKKIWGGISIDEDDESDQDDWYNTDTEQSSLSDDENNLQYDNDVISYYSYHISEDDLPYTIRASSFFYGKDGTLWNRRPCNQRVRTAMQKYVTEKAGVRGTAKHTETILDYWYLFFPNEVLNYILKCNNIFILEKLRQKYNPERDARDKDITEMKAHLGILYTIGK